MIEVMTKVMDFKKFFTKEKEVNDALNTERIPLHIAIIMDGNGRWAQQKQLPRAIGHKSGVEALRDVIETSSSIGVKYLTLYAFSTENWNRPVDEVSTLMKLLVEYLKKEAKELHANNVKINTIGDISRLPEVAQMEIHKAKELTSNNNGLWVNIALNYGGRDELLRGIKKMCSEISMGKLTIGDIDEDLMGNYLDTANTPDPELLIRTSGEYRLSNFLLWQLAYTELWFTNKFWPDFRGSDLIEAIIDYQNRHRRFGKV